MHTSFYVHVQSYFTCTKISARKYKIFQALLDKGNIGCGIFFDLEKAFDTAEHDILLYDICYMILLHDIC